jgi:integral membrane sensor domain MASE1
MEEITQPTDVDVVTSDRPEAPPEIEGGNSSTVIDYTLRFTGAPSLAQLVAVAVASAVYIVLSWLAIIALPSGFPVVSAVFLAIGFGVPFAIWFGGWGFVIAYLGNFIGAGLLSTPPLPLNIALWFGTTDLIQLGLPMLLYRLLARRFGVSPIGKDIYTVRGFIFFVLVAVLPNNIIGGLYGNFILVQTGILPASAFLSAWFVWSLSNVVITLIIGSVLLKFLGPVVERFGLTVRNFLS